jgi:plastocyanin
LIVLFIPNHVFAEEFSVSIPFGAFNPELNTPAEVWYDPPTISVQVDDTITWSNDDREGHTVTSGVGSGRFGWMSDDSCQEILGLIHFKRKEPSDIFAQFILGWKE